METVRSRVIPNQPGPSALIRTDPVESYLFFL